MNFEDAVTEVINDVLKMQKMKRFLAKYVQDLDTEAPCISENSVEFDKDMAELEKCVMTRRKAEFHEARGMIRMAIIVWATRRKEAEAAKSTKKVPAKAPTKAPAKTPSKATRKRA